MIGINHLELRLPFAVHRWQLAELPAFALSRSPPPGQDGSAAPIREAKVMFPGRVQRAADDEQAIVVRAGGTSVNPLGDLHDLGVGHRSSGARHRAEKRS